MGDTWEARIEQGMKLIIEGCKDNPDWRNCNKSCPFTDFCSSIYKDKEIPFTTPDTWEQEGLLL